MNKTPEEKLLSLLFNEDVEAPKNARATSNINYKKFFALLSKNEIRAIELLFGLKDGEKKTYAEASNILNISEDELKIIIQTAMRKIRTSISN